MPLNFGILDTSTPSRVANSFAAGQQQSIQRQNAMLQQQESQMRLQQLQEDRKEMQMFKQKLSNAGQSDDLDAYFEALVDSKNPEYMRIGFEGKQKLKEQREFESFMSGSQPGYSATPDAQPMMQGANGTMIGAVKPQPLVAGRPLGAPGADVPVNAIAPQPAASVNPADRVKIANALVSPNPQIRQWGENQMKMIEPKVVGNAVYDPQTQSFLTPPQQAKATGAPVAVIGPDGRPVLVSRDQAIGMTPYNAATARTTGGDAAAPAAPAALAAPAAPVGKPMTQLQQQAQRKTMAADEASVKTTRNVVSELEKLTDELVGNPDKGVAPHPGLKGITGVQSLFPSMPTSDARKAEQKLETMKGKVMAFGRQLASLEGKLGNMAVQEWKIVSDSIQALDPAAGNLDEQLRDIVRQANNFANVVQERYDLTYDGLDESPSAAASAPDVDQERANANAAIAAGAPTAAVRQRFKQNTGQEL